MDEKQRLLNTLFRSKSERLLNIKFCRGTAAEISPEAFCKEVSGALMQIRTGASEAIDKIVEEFHTVDVAELTASYA